jgi:hypothetical protein
MINLWYDESCYHRELRGPLKVLINLKASLEECNVPYSLNEDKYQYNFLVHYGKEGHLKHEKLEHNSCVIGPQIWPFDTYGEFLKDNPQYYKKLIVPGKSAYLSFLDQGYLEDKVAIWPVGIKDINVDRKNIGRFLVYCKQRPTEDLDSVVSFLEEKNYEYDILSYGSYSQDRFYQCLEKCSRAIIVGRPETQGIAYQEMMSSDMPLLIWDNAEWYDSGIPEKFQKNPSPTSAHYFSEECGEKFYSEEELPEIFDKFMDTNYCPKKYIQRELSYKVTVEKLLNLFEK